MTDDIFSPNDLRKIEQAADEAGLDLMQRAAAAGAEWITKRYPVGSQVLCVAGVGNNGGDALWIAYRLARCHYQVTIFVPDVPKSKATQEALKACLGVGVGQMDQWQPNYLVPDIIVDGLFGIGLDRPLTGIWLAVINGLNAWHVPVLSLDVPSGLDAWRGTIYGVAICATTTLTFLCPKPGLYTADGPDYCGEVLVDSLSLPSYLAPSPCGTIARPSACGLKRKMNSHKGCFGTVGVVGGASGMVGAALLAGRAAIHSGAGKVYVGLLDRVQWEGMIPDLMLCTTLQLRELPIDVHVIGPGLSCTDSAREAFLEAMKANSAKVLDADALNCVAVDATCFDALVGCTNSCILTPHPAEAARLLKTDVQSVQNDRVSAAQLLAKRFNATVVLKGCGTVIAKPDGFFRLNRTGNPALSVAGQGDVLSGICGALLAQGFSGFDAASLAVHVHGLAGDKWNNTQGGFIGMTASMTIPLVSQALNHLMAEDASA